MGNHTSHEAGVVEPVAFELAFLGGFDAVEDRVEADLTSPLLDAAIHPAGSARVEVYTRAVGSREGPGFVLDGFHTASLAEYLRSQAYVRKALEDALIPDRANWDADNSLGRGDIWGYVKLMCVNLSVRTVPRREALEEMKKKSPSMNVDRILSRSDKPDTRSSFCMLLKVAWDDEHFRLAWFRDGKFVGITAE